MSRIVKDIPIDTTEGYQNGDSCMSSEKRRKERKSVKTLNLLDAPRTWFLYDSGVQNVKEAQPDVFDAWIRQYVEDITNVDTSFWEIYHRWGIINSCIRGGVLRLRIQDDGSQVVEAFSSEPEVKVEEKTSDLTSENRDYELPEPA